MKIDYLQKQNLLQNEANKILDSLDLLSFLKKIGKPAVIGSYALGLMSWRDIDIEVVSQPKIEDCMETVNFLFSKQDVYSLFVQDFRKSIYADRPQGLYCGVTYLVKPDIFWKIDIWFLLNAKGLDFVNAIKPKLNEENRLIILKIKNEMRDKTKHGKEVSGIDVYKAVLENGVKNLKQFRKYLKEQGKVI